MECSSILLTLEPSKLFLTPLSNPATTKTPTEADSSNTLPCTPPFLYWFAFLIFHLMSHLNKRPLHLCSTSYFYISVQLCCPVSIQAHRCTWNRHIEPKHIPLYPFKSTNYIFFFLLPLLKGIWKRTANIPLAESNSSQGAFRPPLTLSTYRRNVQSTCCVTHRQHQIQLGPWKELEVY